MLYVGRRNEWIGGGIDKVDYRCVHNDSQEARVMLGTKLNASSHWKGKRL